MSRYVVYILSHARWLTASVVFSLHVDNAFNIPNLRVRGFACKTNTSSNTAFRGFGSSQTMIMCEDMADNIARFLKLDPTFVRQVNLHRDGEPCFYGQRTERSTLQVCWEQVLANAEYEAKRKAVDELCFPLPCERCAYGTYFSTIRFNAQNKLLKRGLAMVPTKYGVAFPVSFRSDCIMLWFRVSSHSLLFEAMDESRHGGHQHLFERFGLSLSLSPLHPLSLTRIKYRWECSCGTRRR